MAEPASSFLRSLEGWLLSDRQTATGKHHGPSADTASHHQAHPWWQVMCLTGVDYFSTLGYQPGIAALAAGALSPIATLVLVLLTLLGALPVYKRVAAESPHGEGSVAMFERLLSWWKGKLFVLVLLGFAATDFIITVTLSAADATAHLVENPYTHSLLAGHAVGATLGLVALLGGVFLKGFKEAIGIAVALVGVYLTLNTVVIAVGIAHVFANPHVFADWKTALYTQHSSVLSMVGVSLLLFPKLALGLSGFETGVAMMPLVRGEAGDNPLHPEGKTRATRRLLVTAALIMSGFLMASSLVTTLLIAPVDFQPGGPANGRALAFLAHRFLGDGFGTVYDLSTVAILWFAGASAMAGLLNLVPRFLPRYGMAPEWARASRPLTLVYTAVAFLVTIIFKADVDAQGGAYATGVLVLMTSAATAVTLSIKRERKSWAHPATLAAALVAAVFAYTTIANVVERPEGVKIAAMFIGAIVVLSLFSRVWRTTELRVGDIVLDEAAQRFIREGVDAEGVLHIIANHPHKCDEAEYDEEERDARESHNIPDDEAILFLEIYVRDASEFSADLEVHGVQVDKHRILRGESAAVPNAIAALLLYLRDQSEHPEHPPQAYFHWGERNPFLYLIRYVLSGQGDVAPLTREILRQTEPDISRRPGIHAAV